jgi:hypothetical protein
MVVVGMETHFATVNQGWWQKSQLVIVVVVHFDFNALLKC